MSDRRPFSQPHRAWTAPQVTPYTVGRYVDGRDGDLLHETHTLYRIEAGPHPNRLLPDAILLGPGNQPTNVASLTFLRDALTAELNEQRATSQALLTQAQALEQALKHLDAQTQQFRDLALKGQQIQGNLQGGQQSTRCPRIPHSPTSRSIRNPLHHGCTGGARLTCTAGPNLRFRVTMDTTLLRTLVGLPARLNAEQAAAVLGFQAHDIPTLVAAGLLSPLGRASKGKNAVKYFALVEVEERRRDPKWLSKATDAAYARFAGRRERGDSSMAE